MLVRRAMDTLALANKAGLVCAGFQQVDSALDKATVAVLLHGSDAAADGCQKLDRNSGPFKMTWAVTLPSSHR